MADKADAFSVFQLIETFREIHPEMPMQMAAVFLLIAMKPGYHRPSYCASWILASRECPETSLR
ncbi:hypothetical protein [Agrobacterium pusense]|nr:hypothetical protein [Agrobacterium pusense]MBW9068295.1 hypothetical protein [Agrobacterium pusense]MBW9081759.1 hypothetical protein [Agrobacterium pusense]MBW9122915.1 hypothetical protein [Agrobacterium pusense]MBW9136869.1 hypothetical protein [Agrobacterium pusense]